MRGILRFGALLGAACAAAACGNVSENPGPDAPAPPDAPPDAPPAVVHRWVIDNQLVPMNNNQAREYGLDLNGDQVIDNQLGLVIATLSGQGFDIQAATSTAVARGSILMLAEAQLGGSAPTAAMFTMYTGANPRPAPCNSPTDTTCRRHLGGTGMFDLAPGSARDLPLGGTILSNTLTAGPGHLQVALLFGFGGAAPVVLDLIGAHVRLQLVSANAVGQSVIAGAISQSQVDTRLLPAIHQTASAVEMADCPGTAPPDCGCAIGSDGKTYLGLFDTMPKDCVITLDEIRNNSLIKSLLAPDMLIEGQAALSVGFAVTAVKATFTP
ncbi:MAG TPA: hypothetical protein VNO30_25045 [Kofleriaceae bacterium]|nr:hypothetical protein [Kofleriaceae bacterium]